MIRGIFVLFFILFSFTCALSGEVISREADNYYAEGVKQQKGDNFLQADTFYQKALLVDPSNLKLKRSILNNYGAMLGQQGFLDEAEENLLESLRIDPNYLPAKLNLGFIYEQRRSELESIKYWLQVLQINLDDIKPKGFVLGELEPESSVGK